MLITIGNREYQVIKEYKDYYLCKYKGLYRVCFLKIDVANNDLFDGYYYSAKYFDKRKSSRPKGEKITMTRVGGKFIRI